MRVGNGIRGPVPDGSDSDAQEVPEDMSDWEARDWEDYSYQPGRGAGGHGGGSSKDPLAGLFEGLQDFNAADIQALLRDLPEPAKATVLGMSVEEAVAVRDTIYTMLYSNVI